jgi:hypothetical protein
MTVTFCLITLWVGVGLFWKTNATDTKKLLLKSLTK